MQPIRELRDRPGATQERVLAGRPLSPGYAVGRARLVRAADRPVPPRRRIRPKDVAHELARLTCALSRAERELDEIAQRVLMEVGEAESQIIRAHLTLIVDQQFVGKVRACIERELVNAEAALESEANALAAVLEGVQSEYLRERAQDIHDVKYRVLRHMGHGAPSQVGSLPVGSIVVAHDVWPSDTLNLNRWNVAGLVLELGGPTSHAAILARSLHVPAVGRVADACRLLAGDANVLVDAQTGEVIVNPGPLTRTSFFSRRSRHEETAQLTASPCQACTTLDGKQVSLLANIDRPEDAREVLHAGMAGVGLFRTEYLWLHSDEAPTFESQLSTYLAILRALPEQPVTLRTFDLGADKQPRFPIAVPGDAGRFARKARGLHLSLMEERLFRTQLRAILVAAADRSDVGILLPMVVSVSELRQALDILGETAAELGIPPSPVGAMLETPSAVFEADGILDLVDFASIGTNDLAEFMLTTETRAERSLDEDAICQPSMLRAMAHVIESARIRDTPLTVCGEAAGSPLGGCLLVGLGIRQLSMSPWRAEKVRMALCRYSMAELEAAAARALAANTCQEVAAQLMCLQR